MRVNFRKAENLFSEERYARVVKVDGNIITYEIACEVRVAQAIISGISSITVSITTPSVVPQTKILSKLSSKRPSKVLSAIGSARSVTKNLAAASGPPVAARSKSAISSSVSGKSIEVSRSILRTGNFQTKKKIIFRNVSNATALTSAVTSLVNESRFDTTEYDQSLSYDAAAIELIAQGYDITESVDFLRRDKTTRENTQGIIEKSRLLVKRTDGRQQDVIQSKLQSTSAGFVPVARLQGDTLPTEAYVTSQFKKFTFKLEIDQSQPGFSSKFTANIEAKDSKGILVAKESIEVSNFDALSDYYTPKDIVRLHVSRTSPGFFSIFASTTDSNIRSCDVFARSLSEGILDSFEKIATIDLDPLTGMETVNVDSDAGVIFRCLPRSKSGQLFANVSGDTLIARNLSTSFAIIYTRLETDAIVLEVNNIYGDVSEIAILRRDVTLKERVFSTISKEPVNRSGLQFRDKDVKVGHLYEYKCEMFNRFSRRSGLSNSRFEEFIYNIGEVTVNAEAGPSTDVVSITATVSGTLDTSTQRLFDQINQFDGVPVFQEKFKQIYNNFSSISLVKVQRFDTITGETSEIGIFKPGLITDRPEGSGKFKYRIEALTRSPADLLEELATADTVRLANSTKSLNLAASAQLSQTSQRVNFTQKFVNKYSLNRGTLSYGSIQAQNHTETAIEQGKTGVSAILNVETPQQLPRVIPLDIRGLPDGRNVLRWRVENPELVDHFLVTCTRSGTDFACGIAQAVPGDSTVTFIDFVTNNFVGSCTYKVTPVGLNFIPGSQITIGTMLMGEIDAG